MVLLPGGLIVTGSHISRLCFLNKSIKESPNVEAAMRKLCKAGEPVRAIEGGGTVEGMISIADIGERWLLAAKAYRQVKVRLGEHCESFRFL